MMQRYPQGETVYRVFVRSVPRATIEDQRARAAVAVGLGSGVQEFHGDQLDDWYKMARPHDVLVCECLEVLPPFRSKKHGGIPTNVLGEIHGWIKAKQLKLIESRTGKEPSPQRWRDAAKNIAIGRRLSADEAKSIGRKGGEKKPVQTILDYWKSHPDHAIFKAIWRGTDGTYDDALDALNDEARKRKFIAVSSTTMAWKVFGHRNKQRRK